MADHFEFSVHNSRLKPTIKSKFDGALVHSFDLGKAGKRFLVETNDNKAIRILDKDNNTVIVEWVYSSEEASHKLTQYVTEHSKSKSLFKIKNLFNGKSKK